MIRRQATWIFLTFSIFYIALTRGHFVGTDEIALYQTTRSLWERGDFAIDHINNTFPGKDGRYYSQYSPGQSLAAVPLYAIGKATEKILNGTGNTRIARALAGPQVGSEPNKWGGDIEIFFANLFNCFVTAALCTLFFLFCTALGTSSRNAFIATVLLGVTSYIAPFSAGFLQHSSEAFFVLLIFYCLFRDSQQSDSRYRFAAGIVAGLMLLFRLQSVIALPVLGLYAIGKIRRREVHVVRGIASLVLPVVVAIAIHAGINYLKFHALAGRYNNEGFHTPLLKGLYGLLFSSGDSIFIFTPLLLLTPWTLIHFARRFRAETVVILALTATYVIFYAKYTAWHGLWSALGPRYLVPIVPLLMLPLGLWIQDRRRTASMMLIPLAIAGAWVQLVHFAVNFAFVYNYEKWPSFKPAFDFLFVPSLAPIAAFSRAFLAHDFRIDMWIVNVHRRSDTAVFLGFLIPIVAAFALCSWQLRQSFRKES